MKIIGKFALFTTLLCSLSGCFDKDEDNILKVGISPDYPPFEFQQNEEIKGFDIDLANEIARKLDKKLVIKSVPIYNLISSLKNGNIDIIISGLSPTEARSKSVSFSDIYYKSKMAILYDTNKSNMKSLSDLEGKTIGVQTGTTMEAFLSDSDAVKTLTVLSQDTNNQLIEHLKIGRIDAVIMDLDQAISFLNASPSFKYFTIDTPEEYGFAVVLPKDKQDLLTQINEIIATLKNNGELDAIGKKWLTQPVSDTNIESIPNIENKPVEVIEIDVIENQQETDLIITEPVQDDAKIAS